MGSEKLQVINNQNRQTINVFKIRGLIFLFYSIVLKEKKGVKEQEKHQPHSSGGELFEVCSYLQYPIRPFKIASIKNVWEQIYSKEDGLQF